MDIEERELLIRIEELIRETNQLFEVRVKALRKVEGMKEEIKEVIEKLIEKKITPPKFIAEEIAKMTNLIAEEDEINNRAR